METWVSSLYCGDVERSIPIKVKLQKVSYHELRQQKSRFFFSFTVRRSLSELAVVEEERRDH